MFEIKINTDNAAFGETIWDKSIAISEILDNIKTYMSSGWTAKEILDTNGNKVGYYKLSEE